MSSMTSIPTMSKCIFCELLQNRIFFAGFFAWFLAQFIKIIVEYIKTGEFKLKVFFMSGGMPSSHSSTCMAVTTAIGLQQGLSSSLFAVSFCFTAIVMHDAAGIRRHAGYQAQILNAIKSGLPPDHPASEKNTLKEVLGHSRREVFAGCFVGILVGIFFPYLY